MPEIDPRSLKLLHAALDMPSDQRDAFIERECADDSALLAVVRRLLAQDAADVCALDQPLEAFAAQLFDEDDSDEIPPGHPIGTWRILSKLGQGGMGSVWLAERADGEFIQRVALKRIKRGMDSAYIQTQFRRERDALARLQHPNIAQLIDGGVDESDRPWFAMELVDGVGLADWISQRQPSLRQRLQLFVKLCRAVAHAHARLVVHRDLKPSNVLVQADDEPRLLDFGIAKLVENDDPEQTLTAQRFFSRAYAAPEQIHGALVTTATDVYALGLLLFELLTGSRYRDVHKDGEATLRPSVALTDITSSRAQIARAQLRGDLDAITTRALADEPLRRYGSADALADDVERHLAGRAVLARPDSFIYRASKFLRRNRGASVAAAIAVFALVAGIIVSVSQMQRAEHMAQRAERGKQFFAGLLQDADPFSDSTARKTTPGDLLDNALTRIERDFADVPGVQIELRQIIMRFLARSGGGGDFGLELARRNVAAARGHYGNHAPQTGSVLSALGIALRKINDEDGARQALQESERLLRDAGPAYAKDRIATMTGLMVLANQIGDLAEGRRLAEAVFEQRQALDGPESPDVAMDLMNLAANALYDERFVESVALAQRAHDMAVKLLGTDHARLSYIDQVLAMAQAYAGDTESAMVNMTHATNLVRATVGPDTWRLANSLGALGLVRLLAGDLPGAIEAYSEGLAYPGKNPTRPQTLYWLGLTQLASGQNESAQKTLTESVELMTGTSSGTRGYLQWGQAALGVAMARNGDAETGEALARQARADLLTSPNARTSKLGEINLLLAEILNARGATDESRRLREEAHATFERILGPDHARTRALLVDR